MRRFAVVVVVAACGRVGFDSTRSRVGDATQDTVAPSDLHGDAALLHQELTAGNADAGDLFGNALAISRDGSTLVAGAPHEDSNATGIGGDETDNTMTDSGAAYVYVHSAGTWTQQVYLKPAVAKAQAFFGGALAISADGNTLAVGEQLCDGGASASGCVEIFTRSGATWTFVQRVTEMFPDQDDLFGISVTLSDDGITLVVGAQQESSAATTINGNQLDNSSVGQGAAFVFVESGGKYSQQAYLKAPNGEEHDAFGSFVVCSSDGNTVAVGAISEASGAPTDPSDNSHPQAGAVYEFTRAGAQWSYRSYIKAPMVTSGDFFGASMSMSGDGTRLVVGAPGSDVTANNAGAVFVYTLGASPALEATLAVPVADNDDQVGVSVALSGDGTTIVTGSALEDSGSTDPTDNSASDAGAAYRYVRTGTTWAPVEYMKRATPTAGDNFGHPIALSQDASVIAIDAGLANASAGAVTVTYFGQ